MGNKRDILVSKLKDSANVDLFFHIFGKKGLITCPARYNANLAVEGDTLVVDGEIQLPINEDVIGDIEEGTATISFYDQEGQEMFVRITY